MACIRETAVPFDVSHQVSLQDLDHLLSIPFGEAKLAAVLLIESGRFKLLDEHLSADVPGWFDRGLISDWHICGRFDLFTLLDWFCMKVLSTMVADSEDTILSWKTSSNLWLRRSTTLDTLIRYQGIMRCIRKEC